MMTDSDGAVVFQSTILRLLAEGCTDTYIAGAVGLSVRTIRKYVADYKEFVGASSRFQAGVEAARRGHVPERAVTT